ncbi:MAG: AbiH family protein [Bacteroidota bacterium]
MNRIILIGNGFDLAHGMKTSYSDFINDYWKSTKAKIQSSSAYSVYIDNLITIDRTPERWLIGDDFESIKNSIQNSSGKLQFKNKFLEILTNKSDIQNWVDIEDEYYRCLKNSFNPISVPKYKISELNKDFEQIKELLKEYLLNTEKEFDRTFKDKRIKNTIGRKIYAPFKLKDFTEETTNLKIEMEFEKLIKDIDGLRDDKVTRVEINPNTMTILGKMDISKSNEDVKKQLKEMLLSSNENHLFDMIPNQTLFLNFNYTWNDQFYNKPKDYQIQNSNKTTNTEFIHIHGSLYEKDKNPIIFGFGDELDDEYLSIEKLNDNQYLENIKSIKYLETDNYKRLLEFINSENYQILIFGHSCGVSDRTLLNTMFEHKNCRSIKTYYHKINETEDNFSNIIRNVTRNFNNKAELRNKVVNKVYCEPMLD